MGGDVAEAAMFSRTCFNPLDCPSSGYWGDADSSIDWCETNYSVTSLVAEPLNAVSNMAFVVPSAIGLWWSVRLGHELRYSGMFAIVLFIGFGSAAFHTTMLSHHQIIGDEIPMMWGALLWFFIVYEPMWCRTKSQSKLFTLLLVFGAVVEPIWHLAYRPTTPFHVLFGCLAFGVLPGIRITFRKVDDADAKWLCRRYLVTGFGAFALWLVDNSMCERLHTSVGYMNLHSLWHVGMAANCYFGTTFAIYARSQQQGSNPEVIWYKLLPSLLRGFVFLPMIRKTATAHNLPDGDSEPARGKELEEEKQKPL